MLESLFLNIDIRFLQSPHLLVNSQCLQLNNKVGNSNNGDSI